MYANGKMRPVKTIPGIRGGEIKENDGRGEFNCVFLRPLKATVHLSVLHTFLEEYSSFLL
jgi:hypothetical protein